MNILIEILKDGQTYNGTLDIDGDIFTKVPLLEDKSIRLVNDLTGEEIYVTETFDLFANCKEVKITKTN